MNRLIAAVFTMKCDLTNSARARDSLLVSGFNSCYVHEGLCHIKAPCFGACWLLNTLILFMILAAKTSPESSNLQRSFNAFNITASSTPSFRPDDFVYI